VSIDLNALLATQRAIKVARADYDFARDGGATGHRPLNSEIIPSGSVVIAKAGLTTTGLTFATSGTLEFHVAGVKVAEADPTINQGFFDYPSFEPMIVTDGDRPIDGFVTGSAITAGVTTVWVFYLPTTD